MQAPDDDEAERLEIELADADGESFEGDLRQKGQRDAQADSRQTAESGERHGFDQELEQDVDATGTNCQTDPDFPGSLRDRDQHDVHDADSPNHQGNGSDKRDECENRGQHGPDHQRHFLRVA